MERGRSQERERDEKNYCHMKGKPTNPRKRSFVSNSDILTFILAPFICINGLLRKPLIFLVEQILYVPFSLFLVKFSRKISRRTAKMVPSAMSAFI